MGEEEEDDDDDDDEGGILVGDEFCWRFKVSEGSDDVRYDCWVRERLLFL